MIVLALSFLSMAQNVNMNTKKFLNLILVFFSDI